MGSLFLHCPQGKDNGTMPTFPSQSWSPGLPEKGNTGNHLSELLPSVLMERKMQTPVRQNSLASGHKQKGSRALGRFGYWRMLLSPRSVHLSSFLTSLVFL